MSSLTVAIACHASCGGSQQVALGLARGLGARGHEVHVVARRRPFGWTDSPGVQLHVLQAGLIDDRVWALDLDWSGAERSAYADLLVSVCRDHGVDVLHYHYAVPFAALAAEAKARLGRDAPRVVGTLHGTDVTRAPAELGGWLASADAVTTVSRAYAELARTRLGLGESPSVVPNFVRIEPCPRRGRLGRPPRVLHISNLRRNKDPHSLGRVFAELARGGARCRVLGEGPGLEAVRAAMEAAGQGGALEALGLDPDVAGAFGDADLLVMTSREESFCLVALEAQACGVPVAAFDVGGLSEVVESGVTGVLHPPGDPVGLARDAAALLADEPRWRRASEAASRRARLFSPQAAFDAYLAVYRRCAAAPRAAFTRPDAAQVEVSA